LLLDFDAKDGSASASRPILNRYEDSWIEALNIVGLIRAGQRDLTDRERFGLLIVVATLVFQNPLSLADRLTPWATARRIPFGVHTPLRGDDLASWIEDQAEFFLPGLGRRLRDRLEPNLGDLMRPPLYLSRLTERPVIAAFGPVQSLVLHAVRDFLKLLYSAAPPWHDRRPPRTHRPFNAAPVLLRSQLLADPEELAETAFHLLVEGLYVLEELLRGRQREPGALELNATLDGWWAYMPYEVELGISFVVKTSELLPLATPERRWREDQHIRHALEGWYRSSYRTGQFYPLAVKDAASVHVEVVVPQREIQMPDRQPDPDPPGSMALTAETRSVKEKIRVAWGKRKEERKRKEQKANRLRGIALLARLPSTFGKKREILLPLGYAFGAEARPADRLYHIYSSRQLHEAPERDIINPHMLLYVPLRLRRSLFVGYVGAVIAYGLIAAFVSAVVGVSLAHDARSDLLATSITLGALAATLSLWLTSSLSAEPIVNQKLVVARHLLELCVGMILAAFLLYAVWGIFDHSVFEKAQTPLTLDDVTEGAKNLWHLW
jgi:hypothetical protein